MKFSPQFQRGGTFYTIFIDKYFQKQRILENLVRIFLRSEDFVEKTGRFLQKLKKNPQNSKKKLKTQGKNSSFRHFQNPAV